MFCAVIMCFEEIFILRSFFLFGKINEALSTLDGCDKWTVNWKYG